MNDLASLLPIVLIVVVFYFLLIRPQRRRQQDMANTQRSLEVGTEVMLGSGIFARVASLEDESLHVEIAPGTVVKVARQAVVRVIEPEPEPEPGLESQHGQDDALTGSERVPDDPRDVDGLDDQPPHDDASHDPEDPREPRS